ncbi:MAG: MFS transporter [Promethearchaeota archaeon]
MGNSEITYQQTSSTSKPNPRKIFILLSSFQMLAMFRRGLFYTFLSIYMRYFLELSVTVTTLYATIPMVLSSIFQTFVWGRLSDRLQRRRTLIILGELIAGTLLLVTYWIHTTFDDLTKAGIVIITGLSVIEIFWSMSNISWSALVSDLYPSKERGRIMGQLTSLGGIGRILGIFLGGMLYEGFFRFQYEGWGFREGALFYIASLVMFLSAIPMFFVPEGGINTQPLVQEKEPNLTKSLDAKIINPQTPSLNESQLLRIFIILIISLMFINFGRNSIATVYSQYLKIPGLFSIKINSEMISYIANVRSLSTILIGLMVGYFKKKFGAGITLLTGVFLAIVFLFLTTFNDLSIIFVGSFFAGASEVIIMAASYEYAAALIPEEKRAKRFGVYNMSFFLSWGLAGTLIVGPIVDSLMKNGKTDIFAYRVAFYIAMLISGIGFLIFVGLLVYRKKIEQISNE